MEQRRRQRRRTLLAVAGLGWLAYKVLQRGRQENLCGQVVLITRWFTRSRAGAGARVCTGRVSVDPRRPGCTGIGRAQQDLRQRGAEVLAVSCDVTDQEQVRSLVDQATQHFGRVDIVVNNAGIIQVGPMSTTTTEDFANALDVMFWGTLYPTLAVLPQMRARRSGRVVNITSIGGMVSVPHLLPYTCAKFAAVGLSEGLRAELGQEGIRVTTVVPGLMRTGSYVQAPSQPSLCAAAPALSPPARPDRPGSGCSPPLAPVYAHRCRVAALTSGAALPSLSCCTTGLIRPRVNAAARSMTLCSDGVGCRIAAMAPLALSCVSPAQSHHCETSTRRYTSPVGASTNLVLGSALSAPVSSSSRTAGTGSASL